MKEETSNKAMRIDKWLWCVRVFKTRSRSTEACAGGIVKLNAADVKPSKELKVADKITIRKGALTLSLEVKDYPKNRVSAKEVELYLTNNTPEEEYEKLRMLREGAFIIRDRGLGRPTKKDRRDIEDFGDWF